MEDFATRTYGTSGLDNRPLFGETSAKVSAGVGPGPECEKSRLPPSRWLLAACPEGTWKWKELVLRSRLPLGMFALHSAPRAAWSGEKFRKFWAVCGKSFTAEGKSREGCLSAFSSYPLQVCVQSFSGFRSALRAQGCF